MADRFNLNSLHLAVKDGVVTCDTTFPSGTVSSSQSGPGGSIGFGSAGSPQILIKVETVANGTAMIAFTTAPSSS